MTNEELLIYSGEAACILAALYVTIKYSRIYGGMILLGFTLKLQGLAVMINSSLPDTGSECLKDYSNWYECMPLWWKVSVHIGQASSLLIAAGLILLVKHLTRRSSGTAQKRAAP